MRLKAFGSQDFLNYNPEAATTLEDAKMILRVTVCFTGIPEWYNTQMYDPVSRDAFLRLTAGSGTGGGWMAPESTEVQGSVSRHVKKQLDDEVKTQKQDEVLHTSASPLAGWPMLGAPQGEAPEERAGSVSFVEGARVMFVGMKAKNGVMGTLMKLQGNRRWKIRLDNGAGMASLKEDNLALVGALEAPGLSATPLVTRKSGSSALCTPSRAGCGRESREAFFIVGTWSDWGELEDMTWDSLGRSYVFRLKLAYRCESFQILQRGSWDTCWHPAQETNGCPGMFYAAEGPDERRKCRGLHWTVGNHLKDEGTRGTLYDIKLFLNSNATPSKVSWRRIAASPHRVA
mmetsp:Transcript_29595/g.68821  ORF Transcript_29595/g.68821 Transcript_29595/m.68821 type:complete len:345 (+) Transcript_29595:32-1066(+)